MAKGRGFRSFARKLFREGRKKLAPAIGAAIEGYIAGGPAPAIAAASVAVASTPRAKTPAQSGGNVAMALPQSLVDTATGVIQGVVSGMKRGGRRRKGGLTSSEMGKITFMSSVLGKRNPAVTLMVMKAMGGRL